MSKSRILKTALTEISKGIKKVDLGDLTRKPNVSERIKAIDRMVGDAGKKVADNVDDWGWKGGKPGEITGKEYINAIYKFDSAKKGSVRKAKQTFIPLDRKFAKQLNYAEMDRLFSSGGSKRIALDHRASVAREFADMQEANIPREWTGKLSKALWKRSEATGTAMPAYAEYSATRYVSLPEYKAISDAMRSMTNDQRETFLSLLPEWTESMEDLVKAAKTL